MLPWGMPSLSTPGPAGAGSSSPPTVAPDTGRGSSSTPSQQTAFGPVNANQRASVGDLNIDARVTNFPDIGPALLILGVIVLAGLLVWWLL